MTKYTAESWQQKQTETRVGNPNTPKCCAWTGDAAEGASGPLGVPQEALNKRRLAVSVVEICFQRSSKFQTPLLVFGDSRDCLSLYLEQIIFGCLEGETLHIHCTVLMLHFGLQSLYVGLVSNLSCFFKNRSLFCNALLIESNYEGRIHKMTECRNYARQRLLVSLRKSGSDENVDIVLRRVNADKRLNIPANVCRPFVHQERTEAEKIVGDFAERRQFFLNSLLFSADDVDMHLSVYIKKSNCGGYQSYSACDNAAGKARPHLTGDLRLDYEWNSYHQNDRQHQCETDEPKRAQAWNAFFHIAYLPGTRTFVERYTEVGT